MWTVGLTVEIKLRFRDGLVWTVGLTVEIKLCSQTGRVLRRVYSLYKCDAQIVAMNTCLFYAQALSTKTCEKIYHLCSYMKA